MTLDPIKTIITSPLLALVTYSLDDTFMILTHHCRRHFNQAERVTESDRFPRIKQGGKCMRTNLFLIVFSHLVGGLQQRPGDRGRAV